MKNWTINNPQMMMRINEARRRPNTAITILISLAIYLAFTFAMVMGGAIYGVVYMQQHTVNSLEDLLAGLITSQGLIIFSMLFTIVLIVLTIVHVRFIEKRRISTIGLKRRGLVREYLIGGWLGIFLVAVTVMPALLTEDIVYNGFSPLILIYLLAFIMQSASEEILFRGYMMTGIASKIGVVLAVIISSALFALIHLVNGGASILSMISLFLIGAMLALYVVRTNNI